MPNLILLFSHKLTSEQEKDAYESLKVKKIEDLPDELKKIWSQIPPEGELDKNILMKIKKYLVKNSNIGDFVLVQGEFGMSCNIVNWCFENDRIPIYSTTKRVVKEIKQPNGDIKSEKIFKHVQFRRYKK